MNNVLPSGPLDEASGIEGDLEFTGVDERNPLLPAGFVSRAVNKRFRNRRAETREGITILPWGKGTGLTRFTSVLGGFVFRDPSSTSAVPVEWIIIAAEGKVYKTRPHAVALEVPLPAGVTLTAATFRKFVQANNSIILLRGLTEDPLVCDNLDVGFRTIPQVNTWDVAFDAATNRVNLPQHNLLVGDPVRFAGSALPAAITENQTYYVLEIPTADDFTVAATPAGTRVTWNTSATDDTVYVGRATILDGAEPIAPAEDGFFMFNRLYLITGKDTIAQSDIGDFTRYQPIPSTFRINEGDSFVLRSIYPANQDTLLALKSGITQKALGLADLATAAGPLNVTQEYGIAGSQCIAASGKDVFWLTNEFRLVSLRLTELNQEQATNVALSDRLLQTFGRINPQYADRTRVTVHGGYLRVALPLDDAQLVSATNEVPAGAQYAVGSPGAYVLSGLTAGQKYQYRQGADDGYLIDNNGTQLHGDGDWVTSGTVHLYAWGTDGDNVVTSPVDVTATVKAVTAEGVNTGIAIYDFQALAYDPATNLRGAWAGVDEAANVVCVVDWLKFSFAGKGRLGFIGADGLLHLCDDGFEDEQLLPLTPFVDLLPDGAATGVAGSTLRINGGTIVTAINNASNTATQWGAPADTTTWKNNFWQDAGGRGGYNPAATNPWTAPNTTITQIEGGLRFTATNGVLPEVKIGGAVFQNGYANLHAISFPLLFVDSHDTPAVTAVPIADLVRTRAYLCSREDFKRYTCLANQIRTWAPQYTIRTITQGINTGQDHITNETRDRLKYFAPHDKPDWDPSNVNNDYNNPNREDYSYEMTDDGILLGDGIDIDAQQEYLDRAPVNEHGLWMQLEIANAAGRLELVAAAMEAQAGQVLAGVMIAA